MRLIRWNGALPLWLALATALAACKDSTAPVSAAAIEIVSTPVQGGVAGEVITASPAFVVRDNEGQALGGIGVSVTVTSGEGRLANAPRRTARGGTTSVGAWTLGETAGPNELTITVDGLAPATITVEAKAGPPATLTHAGGNGQLALAATALAVPVSFRVTDRFGNGVPDAVAHLDVRSGGGTLEQSTAISNDEGVVTLPAWVLGKSALPQSVRARVGSASLDFSARVRTDYDIEVRFYGPAMTDEQRALFTEAAARLSAIITGDVADVALSNFPVDDVCGTTGVDPLTGMIDDIVLYAAVRQMDGEGGVLARAGTCGFREASLGSHPVVGVMEFDAADIAELQETGHLHDTIVHEMLHLIGLSRRLWTIHGYLQGAGTTEVAYTGPLARQGCLDTGGLSPCALTVPIENTGGAGTANSHWRESTFANELMTGFINRGVNPVSLTTIGALADLGYVVNPAAHDAYAVPTPGEALFGKPQRGAPFGADWEGELPTGMVMVGPGRMEVREQARREP